MRQNALIRKVLFPLRHTPVHPQWFALRSEKKLGQLGSIASGVVLDIGAGEMAVRVHLPEACEYISLDYYVTARDWYGTSPSIFGDGQNLPIKSESVDTVFLLDVLEHLPRPDACIAEVRRVLRPGGQLIIQVPFLYPLHDEPYDFHRWTSHGLREMADRHRFQGSIETWTGHPIETSALLMNLALSKIVLNWMRCRNPLVIISPLLLIMIPILNTVSYLLASLCSKDSFMPQSYQSVWRKPE